MIDIRKVNKMLGLYEHNQRALLNDVKMCKLDSSGEFFHTEFVRLHKGINALNQVIRGWKTLVELGEVTK